VPNLFRAARKAAPKEENSSFFFAGVLAPNALLVIFLVVGALPVGMFLAPREPLLIVPLGAFGVLE
jgi:multidrug efflux pump subunit AcrB